MSKKITISKYKGNTQWSVDVEDSYGTEHHLGYVGNDFDDQLLYAKAEYIWANEVKPKEDLMGKAIAECIQMDKDRGVEPNLD
tara:strand:+ start:467 stop:715 length:249 start_codon:yes stop_codon:yes gene_type:complete